MGIYSTNRIDGLSSFGESIDFSDPALLHGPSLMEACIEICECDQNMFETLIEFDFMSENNLRTMTESEAVALNEATDGGKISGIIEKIKEVVSKAINAIKSGAAKIVDKIMEIVRADKTIKKRYDDVLKIENLEGFKGIKNYTMAKPYQTMKNLPGITKKLKSIEPTLKKISAEGYDGDFIRDIKDNVDGTELRLKADEYIKNSFYDKVDTFIPSGQQLAAIKYGFDNIPDCIKYVKEMAASTTKELNAVKKYLKVQRRENKKDNPSEARKYATMYNYVSKESKDILKACSQYIGTLKKQLAAHRKAYIICGRYAYNYDKKKKGEAEKSENTNESVNFAIAESSDAFVFGL